MKYYRTYIFHFLTSTGVKVYAGLRTSKFENPSDDPYCGSGTRIKLAVKKYGKQCIINKQWFDHESRKAMEDAEIELIDLIKSECDNCVNEHEGGRGGNTLKYMSEEDKIARATKIGNSHRGKPKSKESVEASRAALIGRKLSAEHKEKIRNIQLNRDPSIDEHCANVCRTEICWQEPMMSVLRDEWLNTVDSKGNRYKYGRFQTHCANKGIISDISLRRLVKYFEANHD